VTLIFTAQSARHLLAPSGKSEVGRFADGELRVKILSEVKGETVVLVANLCPPSDNILEAALLLDALIRAKADVHVVIPYFGYARQDRVVKPGDAVGAHVVSSLFYRAKQIDVIDCHTERLHDFLTYSNHIPVEVFLPKLNSIRDAVVVGPDTGAKKRAMELSELLGCANAWFEKTRPKADVAQIGQLHGDVEKKNAIIFDDMITTGGTTIDAAKACHAHGARSVVACATHGVFAGDAKQKLAQSPIKNVYVTNTLPNKPEGKINVVDIRPFLREMLDLA